MCSMDTKHLGWHFLRPLKTDIHNILAIRPIDPMRVWNITIPRALTTNNWLWRKGSIAVIIILMLIGNELHPNLQYYSTPIMSPVERMFLTVSMTFYLFRLPWKVDYGKIYIKCSIISILRLWPARWCNGMGNSAPLVPTGSSPHKGPANVCHKFWC